MALREPHRQDGAGAPAPGALRDDDDGGYLRPAGRRQLADPAHLYLWVPNALLPDGLAVMEAWGFDYKTNIVWHKIRKDGGSDGRGVGFYFRNVTELLLFGVRGKNARTLAPGRRQVNMLETRKREHSRKPDEQYALIEVLLHRPLSRTVRARHAAGLDLLGQPGGRELQADLGYLCAQLGGAADSGGIERQENPKLDRR